MILLHHWVIPVGNNGGLIKGDAQMPVAILILTPVAMFAARIFSARRQPAITDELFSTRKPGDVPDIRHYRPGAQHPEAGKYF